jgi:transcription elongation factor SPT5
MTDDGLVNVACDDKDLGEVPFPVAELDKYFAVGDRVRVMAGQHRDETGLVVHVKESTCVVVSDTTTQQIQVRGAGRCVWVHGAR